MKKIKSLFAIFPYYPIKMNQDLKRLWTESLSSTSVKYKLLYRFSEVFIMVIKSLGIKFGQSKSRIFEFEILNDKKNESDFLMQNKVVHLFQSGNPESIEIINDKLKFQNFCLQNHFPTPTKLGEIRSGKIYWDSEYPWFNNKSFIVKPTKGSQSKGIRDFVLSNEGRYIILDENREISFSAVNDYLEHFIKQGEFIIQERIMPGLEFLKIGIMSIPILRIITISDDTNVKLLNPVMIINPEKNYLNSKLINKRFFAIDILNGRINHEIYFGKCSDGQILIKDFYIPDWEKIVELLIKAHKILNTVKIIGWDLGIGDGGFKIIEANKSPWIEIHQKFPFNAEGFQKELLCLYK
ncbi:MAG: sugar-transfer associated ATP-grasp domain-containing protein [Spirosomataceae bacterium]|jgi:hypothetical protein